MNVREIIFLVLGAVVGLSGIGATLVWSSEAGILALLVLGMLLLVLLVLQRRQLARVQQRTLTILNTMRSKPTERVTSQPQQSLDVPTKKILGLLQAQQMSMEILNDKVEKISNSHQIEGKSSE